LVQNKRVVVVGAGIGGLVCALLLAARGLDVVLLERAKTPGGKMRQVGIGTSLLDAGPTVFTMRWVFDKIFAEVGASLSDHLALKKVDVLARHAWIGGDRLDLFADFERSVEAIGDLSGQADAMNFRTFCQRAREVYNLLERSFICDQRPNPLRLVSRVGPARLLELGRIKPFTTLWQEISRHFHDPRLRQLFARYATYCGSSPFAAPATLMLVAHVEQDGVWLVEGGMHKIAATLAQLAENRGAVLRYEAEVGEILVSRGQVAGIVLTNGERIATDSVVLNADVAALPAGKFGPLAAKATRSYPLTSRSLSAVTWAILAEADGFPLSHHNVFFSSDYAAEFSDIFERQRLPVTPSVYVCAQDRVAGPIERAAGKQRLFCIVNAPATGDRQQFSPAEIVQCEKQIFNLLASCGLRLRIATGEKVITTPNDFNRLFPATGGALYGRSSHGWMASFARPGSRSRIKGLYLAGGSTHPGPGVPMAAISGRLAASSLMADLNLTN
jgi:1-hydroxycarotenoid 3,4-desaturase